MIIMSYLGRGMRSFQSAAGSGLPAAGFQYGLMRKIWELIAFFCLAFLTAAAQDGTGPGYVSQHFTKHVYMIPMRDGVKLYTAVYVPKDTTRIYPFLMKRTCYSVAPYGADDYPASLGPSEELMKAGFIFVYQDVRGKHHSEGHWEEIRPFIPNKHGTQTDEASDTYDTVDWLLSHVAYNSGKVGVWGISYPGFFATEAAIAGHPAIKAVSPQAPVTNWFLGDDTHHNGAFFLQDEFDFDYGFFNSTNGPMKGKLPPISARYADNYAFFLKLGSVANVNRRYYHHLIPFWDTVMMHPDYDRWWQQRDAAQYLSHVKPATLVVGGWYDAEDQWGTVHTYRQIEALNTPNRNTLVMGPWYHGGWSVPVMDHLGDIPFGANTSRWFQRYVETPFFMHYLKDTPWTPLPEALLFDVGTGKWLSFSRWPAREILPRRIYFRGDDSLSFSPPNRAGGWDEYLSDPARPVPYQGGIHAGRGVTYMDADQRFASRRPDVLSFSTPVLDTDVTLAGPMEADLYVSTTGTDADFIVKLIDVYPDTASGHMPGPGYQALVRAEVMRGKYRTSFSHPEPFVPGRPTEVNYHVPDVLYTFRKGHRLMIQVESSWFPLVDRNPQVFEDIYQAADSDFTPATIRLYHTRGRASCLKTGVLPASAQKFFSVRAE